MDTFAGILLYVTLMITFFVGTAFFMASGLWYIGLPVFILGLTAIIYWMTTPLR